MVTMTMKPYATSPAWPLVPSRLRRDASVRSTLLSAEPTSRMGGGLVAPRLAGAVLGLTRGAAGAGAVVAATHGVLRRI